MSTADNGDVFVFTCSCCGKQHSGMPTFAWECPIEVLYVPEVERPRRVVLSSETCVIDNSAFFIRGCVLVPVQGLTALFAWGMWPQVHESDYLEYAHGLSERSLREGVSVPGRLGSVPPMYPDAELDVLVHIKPIGTRPDIELVGNGHPFAVDQRAGITQEQVRVIAEQLLHPTEPNPKRRSWWSRR